MEKGSTTRIVVINLFIIQEHKSLWQAGKKKKDAFNSRPDSWKYFHISLTLETSLIGPLAQTRHKYTCLFKMLSRRNAVSFIEPNLPLKCLYIGARERRQQCQTVTSLRERLRMDQGDVKI